MYAPSCAIENKTAGYIAVFNSKPATQSASASAPAAGAEAQGFGFRDLIDVVNPLHHLPIVGAVYRHLTGDQIRPEAKIMGGALFGGGIGAAVAMADAAFTQVQGKDIGATLISSVVGTDHKQDAQILAKARAQALAESSPCAAKAQMALDMSRALDRYQAQQNQR